ncbi:MAG: hypothetical protein ACREXR_17805, partial [Gammaproteobacteria bacterium]
MGMGLAHCGKNRLLAASLIALASQFAGAAEPCEPIVGKLASVEGTVEIQRVGQESWQKGSLNQSLCQGDS